MRALPSDEVHVWYALCGELDLAALRARYVELLSAEERRRLDRFAFERDQRQFLAGRVLLRTTLSQYAPVTPRAWEFENAPGGKPRIAHSSSLPRLRFNLSNAPRLVACAVTASDAVGIDVESLDRAVNLNIVPYCLSPREIVRLESTPEPEKKELFLRYWTLKEAYAKARGLGLVVGLKRIEFTFHSTGPPTVAFAAEVEDTPEQWQFHQRRVDSSHYLAVALRRRANNSHTFVVSQAADLLASIPPSSKRV